MPPWAPWKLPGPLHLPGVRVAHEFPVAVTTKYDLEHGALRSAKLRSAAGRRTAEAFSKQETLAWSKSRSYPGRPVSLRAPGRIIPFQRGHGREQAGLDRGL